MGCVSFFFIVKYDEEIFFFIKVNYLYIKNESKKG